ncbi:MAG: dTDP-4-dehydrorhamnose reductase [Parvularculaceae bacterium]|nr:dTDP-4-dehydrorhamnose reductase [Parvularculaceae bacterium]
MRILLFGASGQVGRETVEAAARRGNDLVALSRDDADLSAAGAGAAAIVALKPDAVINAAAWTAVDKAETEQAPARRLNAQAPAELARACVQTGARFIHLSTDYVFDGAAPGPLDETAPTGPLNVYGATKLEGEGAVLAAHPAAVVIRTSWVYAAHGANFVRTMLRLAETKPELSIVGDQIGGPTPASAIAEACLDTAARDGPGGLYHFQGAPPVSWADFAEAIFAAADKAVRVKKILTRDYKTPALRPLRTVLNCAKILKDYGIRQPDWRIGLAGVASRLENSQQTNGLGKS